MASFRPTRRRQLERWLVLSVLILQQLVWVFTSSGGTAAAIRILPQHHGAVAPPSSSPLSAGLSPEEDGTSFGNEKQRKRSYTEHFRRYFDEQTSTKMIGPSSSGGGGGGFEESKRKVPSCPDPLHN